MIVEQLPEFKKDLKNLLKRYRTLEQDLDVVNWIWRTNQEKALPLVTKSQIWDYKPASLRSKK